MNALLDSDVVDFAPPLSWPQRLIRERQVQRLTGRQLAQRSGVSGATISRFEVHQGEMWLSKFIAITEALGFQLEWRRKAQRGEGERS